MFFARWGLRGFWLPFAIGPLMEMGPMLLYLMCLDWQRVIHTQEAEQNRNLTATTTDASSSKAASDELSSENPSLSSGSGDSDSILSPDPEAASINNVIGECESERTPLLGNRQSIDPSAQTKVVPKAKFLWLLPLLCCVSLIIAISIVLRIYRPLILPFDLHNESNVTVSISPTSLFHTHSHVQSASSLSN